MLCIESLCACNVCVKQVGDLQLFTLYYIFTEEESVEFIAWGKMFKAGE